VENKWAKAFYRKKSILRDTACRTCSPPTRIFSRTIVLLAVTCFQLCVERGTNNSVRKMPNTRKSVRSVHPNRPRKRKFNYNPEKMEAETEFVSTSAKKVKNASYDDIEIDDGHSNVILNFLTVFNFLSMCLKCKECDGEVTFSRTCVRGLGFNLLLKCKCKNQRRILSSPMVNTAYEINRRLLFVMRTTCGSKEHVQRYST